MNLSRPLSALLYAGLLLGAFSVSGHNISESNARFVEGLNGPAIAAFLYLGAKHMVTGYDHLLFLVGVVFFLSRPRDVVIFVSLFTLGHSITLLTGVLADWQVNAYLVDAVIGLSVVYKAFENIGGFDRAGRFRINMLSFNVGVELGQLAALAVVLLALVKWRNSPSFERQAFAANTVVMSCGFVFAGYQLTGYVLAR
jgi:hypothetical protein